MLVQILNAWVSQNHSVHDAATAAVIGMNVEWLLLSCKRHGKWRVRLYAIASYYTGSVGLSLGSKGRLLQFKVRLSYHIFDIPGVVGKVGWRRSTMSKSALSAALQSSKSGTELNTLPVQDSGTSSLARSAFPCLYQDAKSVEDTFEVDLDLNKLSLGKSPGPASFRRRSLDDAVSLSCNTQSITCKESFSTRLWLHNYPYARMLNLCDTQLDIFTAFLHVSEALVKSSDRSITLYQAIRQGPRLCYLICTSFMCTLTVQHMSSCALAWRCCAWAHQLVVCMVFGSVLLSNT